MVIIKVVQFKLFHTSLTKLKTVFNVQVAKQHADIVITEVGGTVGDIESLPFLEAIRQMKRDLGK